RLLLAPGRALLAGVSDRPGGPVGPAVRLRPGLLAFADRDPARHGAAAGRLWPARPANRRRNHARSTQGMTPDHRHLDHQHGHTFPAGFVWGAATAAYQIEGSASADGRG